MVQYCTVLSNNPFISACGPFAVMGRQLLRHKC